MIYVCVSVAGGLILPRIEQTYFATSAPSLSIASAQAYLSAAASGMMALTGIVFALAFVVVQFNAIAYSPRMVIFFANDRILFHSLGAFTATFVYALFTLAWIDRFGSGAVPFFSCLIAGLMLVASMLLFSRLIQRLADLQINSVLRRVGDKGRAVIAEMFRPLKREPHLTATKSADSDSVQLGSLGQTLEYHGTPRTIAKFDIKNLVRQAQEAEGVIVLSCAVGDTLIEGTSFLKVYGAKKELAEKPLLQGIRLERERTFEQDPKYPIRLLVDIAIRALSPAINDPTTAVQTIDQIEDLVQRLGGCDLDAGHARDARGKVRLIFPVPSWEDYLSLAFDEIRQYGATSVQVMRRLRSALTNLTQSLPATRATAVEHYLHHLDTVIAHSTLDSEDRRMATQEDRQGLGLSRTQSPPLSGVCNRAKHELYFRSRRRGHHAGPPGLIGRAAVAGRCYASCGKHRHPDARVDGVAVAQDGL